jgi:hypothetical protein
MATIGNTVPTLVDVAKRLQPDGSLDRIAELLAQSNEIIQDVPMYEGNMLTGHLTTLRTSLPLVYWRRYNEGVLPSKSTTGQITEVTAMLEAWSEIDWDLLNLNNMSAAWRMSEEAPFVESMGIEFSRVLFYGNMAVDPKTFTGLATRFNDINIGESGSAAKDGACLDAGGTGSDNTSIWLIGWGVNSVHGIYPKGSKAGLQSEDLGRIVTKDVNGGLYTVAHTHFKWDCGIAVRDWRYIVRIANIDYSDLIANVAGTATDLPVTLIKALDRRPMNAAAANWRFYAARPIFTMLRVQSLTKSQYTTTFANVGGQDVGDFMGVPIRRVDQLLTTEARLT